MTVDIRAAEEHATEALARVQTLLDRGRWEFIGTPNTMQRLVREAVLGEKIPVKTAAQIRQELKDGTQ